MCNNPSVIHTNMINVRENQPGARKKLGRGNTKKHFDLALKPLSCYIKTELPNKLISNNQKT